MEKQQESPKPKKAPTNEKPIPHIPLPFDEVMKDVLKVKPPQKHKEGRRYASDGKKTRKSPKRIGLA
jgi:hypothetical protein